jgi:drug/metabolite transporter (DMT)-like permease
MSPRILFSFLVIYIVWGSTFTAIKWGLEEFPPFTLAGLRFIAAGLVFLLLSRGKGISKLTSSEFLREVMIGILLTLANAGVCWSEQYLSSGVAALIVGSIPLQFAIVNWIAFEKKKPQLMAIFGLVVGLVGLAVISWESSSVTSTIVVLGLLLANLSWTVGSLVIRVTRSPLSSMARGSIQMTVGGIVLMILSPLIGEKATDWSTITSTGVLSVLYLGLMGTVLAYTCYSYLLKEVAPEITSTYALVNPLLAIIFGMIYLNEPITLRVVLASLLIITSVALVIYGPKLIKSEKLLAFVQSLKIGPTE